MYAIVSRRLWSVIEQPSYFGFGVLNPVTFVDTKKSRKISTNLLTNFSRPIILYLTMLANFDTATETTSFEMQAEHSMIRVYRRHAARAISEERWEVAEIFFDRILDVCPTLTEAWLMKGLLRQYCREDDHAAIRCYRKVIELCGDDLNHPHARHARATLGRLMTVWG